MIAQKKLNEEQKREDDFTSIPPQRLSSARRRIEDSDSDEDSDESPPASQKEKLNKRSKAIKKTGNRHDLIKAPSKLNKLNRSVSSDCQFMTEGEMSSYSSLLSKFEESKI